MTRAGIENIRTKMRTIPGIQFVAVFNDQVAKYKDNSKDNPEYDFLKPALLFEILGQSDIDQLGGGFQLYDGVIVRCHLIHEQYDTKDGEMEQNLDVFDLKQAIFAELDRFKPDGFGQFIRCAEMRDYNHNNIYVFTQDYRTTFVDIQNETPSDVKQPPTLLEINPVTVISN